MKKVALSLALVCLSVPAFAAGGKFEGTCIVVQPPTAASPGKTLASVPVSLNPGETQTILKQNHILYQVSLFDLQGTSPLIHSLSVVITYGAPNFLGEAISDYTDAAIASGTVPTAHVILPNFPVFSCQSN